MGYNRAGAKRKQKLKETKRLAEQRAKKLAAEAGNTGRPQPANQPAAPVKS
jgi:hypothetical protein